MSNNRKMITKIVPAASGWSVCMPVSNDEGLYESLYEMEIIAWAVSVEIDEYGEVFSTGAQPVIAEQVLHARDKVIKRPGGGYIMPEMMDWPDESAVVAYLNTKEAIRIRARDLASATQQVQAQTSGAAQQQEQAVTGNR